MSELILRTYDVELSTALLYPVDMSQLLYSAKCISEKTLDEVETREKSTEDRKKILLRAIKIAVGLDHKKLKTFAEALSRFEETERLAETIKNEYERAYPDERNDTQSLAVDQSCHGYQSMTFEERASNVLRCHYADLSTLLQNPSQVAKVLYGERIISDTTLSAVEATKQSLSESRAVLLKAVRNAIWKDHRSLKAFADALEKCECVPNGSILMKDYLGKVLHPDEGFSNQSETMVSIALGRDFSSMRSKFETEFGKICDAVRHAHISLEDLRNFVHEYSDCYLPQLANAVTSNDVLDLMCDKCTLIDINYLKAVVTKFKIKKAMPCVQSYELLADEFCRYLPIRVCLEQKFLIARSYSPLKSDTVITLTLDCHPDHYTMEFVRDTISKSFGTLAKSVQLVSLKERDNLIVVTCFFPNSLTSSLIVPAQKSSTINLMKKRGLVEFTIDEKVVWKRGGDEPENEGVDSCLNIEQVVIQHSNASELYEMLETSEKKSRRLSMQLRMLRAALKKRNSSIEPEIEETILEGEDEEIELKDAAIQVDTLQLNVQKIVVELQKESSDQTVGFFISEGKGLVFDDQEHAIFISKLTPGGLAEKNGRLKPGDCIVSINGQNMTHSTKEEALAALINVGDVCTLVVKREIIAERRHDTISDPLSLSRQTTRSGLRRSFKYRPSVASVAMNCRRCSSLPDAISNAQAVFYNNRVIVGGHYSAQNAILFEYDPDTDSWCTLATSPVWFFGLTVFQDKVTVVGGFDSKAQSFSNKLFVMDKQSKYCRSDCLPPMLTARAQPAVVSKGNNIAVAGGRNTQDNLTIVEVYHSPTNLWYSAHSLLHGRSSINSVLHKGFWYMLGGEMSDHVVSKNLRTNLQTLVNSALSRMGSVSRVKTIKAPCKNFAAAATIGQNLLAIEGLPDTAGTIYLLCEEDPVSWIKVGHLPVSLSHSCAVSLSEEEILVIGGRDETGKHSSMVYRLHLQKHLGQR